jgi:hypothetical protein
METEKSLIENYENKVNSLLKKIDFLEAKIKELKSNFLY